MKKSIVWVFILPYTVIESLATWNAAITADICGFSLAPPASATSISANLMINLDKTLGGISTEKETAFL